ncbi:NAD(P)H-dependent FMN reductase [Phanerochaete sordida]|uniref:NAD(P)H-dependent FMN reductase n=1 Tax=Phanerochaete sordida TaxID=48140 RepID=A0A9P3G0X1_9APHY|nr:NAD(P)H-dependent FMN reductase [Phanerochaete sordida]
MSQPIRLALLLGSCRRGGNNTGIAAWAHKLIDARLNPAGEPKAFEIIVVDPTQAPQPYGPILDSSRIPAQINDATGYSTEPLQAWSRLIASCAGFIVVTPQYNGGYPGELKNAIDHLYAEWRGKPVITIAFGGHGGGKCALQLQGVFAQLKMRMPAEPVCVTLPRTYIEGADRVPVDGDFPEFLAQYADAVGEATDKLRASLVPSEST